VKVEEQNEPLQGKHTLEHHLIRSPSKLMEASHALDSSANEEDDVFEDAALLRSQYDASNEGSLLTVTRPLSRLILYFMA